MIHPSVLWCPVCVHLVCICVVYFGCEFFHPLNCVYGFFVSQKCVLYICVFISIASHHEVQLNWCIAQTLSCTSYIYIYIYIYIYTNIVQYTYSCILYKNLDAFYKLPGALMRKVLTSYSSTYGSCSLLASFLLLCVWHCPSTALVLHIHAPQLILSDCTTQMVTPPLRGVCCRSVCQAYGEQLVTTAFTATMMEKLLVDNLDIVAVYSVCAWIYCCT